MRWLHLKERRLSEVDDRFAHDRLQPVAVHVHGAEPVAG